MTQLYNIDDGFGILKKKRKITSILFFSAVLLLVLIVTITYFSHSYLIMFIDIILTTIYLWALFTYIFYFRLLYNEEYHFLAKIEHYNHEIIDGIINTLDNEVTTIKKMEVNLLNINGRTIYIECRRKPESFTANLHVKLEIVDNFIVGYEVI